MKDQPTIDVPAKPSRVQLPFLLVFFALFGGGCNSILDPIEQRFLFRPRTADPAYLSAIASPDGGIEEVRLKASDGVTLHGWLKRPKITPVSGRFPLVIVFGGVRRETSWLIDRGEKPEHWGWLFVNYRGFGLSEGESSERVVLEDTKFVFDYAAARHDVEASNIVVFGRSLGSYFSVALAQARKVRGAILATPFDSFSALGQERYPWLPVSFLLNGRYDAATIAPKVNVPALFLLAEHDDVTPMENGAALARAWGGPQRTVTLTGARHYGVEGRDEFWNAVAEFLREVELAPSRPDGYAGQQGAQP
ncbi:MAG TPA: alpha/beta hydrolase [Candidatus Binatia bacterium]|nr:alpha/beta hydrolase [Candidatus Binatia bacterium]